MSMLSDCLTFYGGDMPDAELMDLAAEGVVFESDVVAEQLDRMLQIIQVTLPFGKFRIPMVFAE